MQDGPRYLLFVSKPTGYEIREADADLAAGRLTRRESGRDLLRSLDERMKPLDADA